MKFINHYIEKKYYINESVPTPLGPPPSPASHCFFMCFVEQIFEKKVQRNFISSRKKWMLVTVL